MSTEPENPINDPLTIALFEKALSEMLSNCGLTAYGVIQAMAVSLARILYGLQRLHGLDGANQGADLFDTILEAALIRMLNPPEDKSPTHEGNSMVH